MSANIGLRCNSCGERRNFSIELKPLSNEIILDCDNCGMTDRWDDGFGRLDIQPVCGRCGGGSRGFSTDMSMFDSELIIECDDCGLTDRWVD